MSEIDALLLEEARRAIDRQAEDIKAVRDRSAQLLTFAGVVATFAGGIALKESHPTNALAFLGLASFIGVAFCMGAIHRPRVLKFSNDVEFIVQNWKLPAQTLDEVTQQLARAHAAHWHENYGKFERMHKIYSVAISAFVLEMVFMTLALAWR